MAPRDYYDILGVDRQVSPEQLKKAYRKLAAQYHPDRNQGNKEAEEKFKELSEAYAVLSDAGKRRNYNRFGHAGFRQQYSREDIFNNFDPADLFREFGMGEDVFSQFFTGKGRAGRRPRAKSARTKGGAGFFGDFGENYSPPPPRRGTDLSFDLHISLAEAVFGAERLIAFNSSDGVVKITAKVPPGVTTGKKLRLSGQGYPSPQAGGPPGDLMVNILVDQHPVFSREGDDLAMEVEIRPTQALLGTSVQIETLEGKTLNLKIPSGAGSHSRLRVKGFGALRLGSGGRGDLFVRVLVSSPEKLTPRQEELIRALAEEGL
ncbi:MAG: DnaJ C-terminal domain-containing protein [Pseudomonadota bacterium]